MPRSRSWALARGLGIALSGVVIATVLVPTAAFGVGGPTVSFSAPAVDGDNGWYRTRPSRRRLSGRTVSDVPEPGPTEEPADSASRYRDQSRPGVRMSDEMRFADLAALASERRPDEARLHDLAMRIGADLEGLRELVDRFGDSGNPVLVRYVAVPLARAPWDWTEPAGELNGIVLDFIERAGQTDDGPTLGGCLTAVHGLNAIGLLAARSGSDRSGLGDFMLHCLAHPDLNVRSGCLQLMSHLYVDHSLERVATPESIAALRAQVARVAVYDGERLADDLESLRGFW